MLPPVNSEVLNAGSIFTYLMLHGLNSEDIGELSLRQRVKLSISSTNV